MKIEIAPSEFFGKRYRKRKNGVIWKAIAEHPTTFGERVLVQLESPLGRFRYATRYEMRNYYTEVTDD